MLVSAALTCVLANGNHIILIHSHKLRKIPNFFLIILSSICFPPQGSYLQSFYQKAPDSTSVSDKKNHEKSQENSVFEALRQTPERSAIFPD
jgi:hypothetical protein